MLLQGTAPFQVIFDSWIESNPGFDYYLKRHLLKQSPFPPKGFNSSALTCNIVL